MTTGGFFGSGGKSWSWGKLHDTSLMNRWVGGVLTDVGEPKQQTHYTERTPLFDKNGNPKMELPITLLCDGAGPNVPNIPAPDGVTTDMKRQALNVRNMNDSTDSGRRTFWVKGSMKKGLGDKLREVGVSEPPMGCEIYMRFTGITAYDNGDGRVWEFLYFPPSGGSAQAGGFFTEEASASAPPAPPANAWGAPASAPQQPPAPPSAPNPPADPWGAAPAAQGSAPPAFGGQPSSGGGQQTVNPWG